MKYLAHIVSTTFELLVYDELRLDIRHLPQNKFVTLNMYELMHDLLPLPRLRTLRCRYHHDSVEMLDVVGHQLIVSTLEYAYLLQMIEALVRFVFERLVTITRQN